MGNITTIGLDLAKNVFQVAAVDQAGSVVMRKLAAPRLESSLSLRGFRRVSSG